MERFPGHLGEAISVCALRFDGYAYETRVRKRGLQGGGGDLRLWTEQIVTTRRLFAEEKCNFAAFFGLQRYLHKWGGERLTKQSTEHCAYDLLFLHLYRRPVPRPYAMAAYVDQWDRLYRPEAEELAAQVRQSFRRVGDGPIVSP